MTEFRRSVGGEPSFQVDSACRNASAQAVTDRSKISRAKARGESGFDDKSEEFNLGLRLPRETHGISWLPKDLQRRPIYACKNTLHAKSEYIRIDEMRSYH